MTSGARDESRRQADPPQRNERKVPKKEKGTLPEGVDRKTDQILDHSESKADHGPILDRERTPPGALARPSEKNGDDANTQERMGIRRYFPRLLGSIVTSSEQLWFPKQIVQCSTSHSGSTR